MAEFIDFLRQLHPNGPWWLTAIDQVTGAITTKRFEPGEEEAAAAFVRKHDGSRNLYYQVNEPRQELGDKKAKKGDITKVHFVHADLDPGPAEEPDAAKARYVAALESLGLRPSYLIDSGNGLQALFRLENPVALTGDDIVDSVEARNRGLMQALGCDDTSTYNVDRILRLPGTTNLPNKKKQAAGRVPLPSRLLSVDDTVRYTLADFTPIERCEAKSTPSALDDVIRDERLRTLVREGELPGKTFKSRSEAVFSAVGWMNREGVRDEVIIAAILDPANSISAHVREQADPERYARRQLEQVRQKQQGPANVPPPELHWHGAEDPQPPAWLVKGLVPQQGVGLVSGAWGTHKSFVVLDLAGAVMTGTPFAGRQTKRRGGVLFIAAEAAADLPIRLAGLAEHKKLSTPQGDLFSKRRYQLPFAWIDRCQPLRNKGSLAELKAVAAEAAREMRETHGVDLALIVVDTIAVAAGFTDENAAAEGQGVMNTLHDLSKATGAAVVAVDHFGKNEERGTRGSSAKEASADFVLVLRSGATGSSMTVRKLRGGASEIEIPFDRRVVDMGVDEDGDRVTTCVIEWGEPGSRPFRARERKRNWSGPTLQQAIDSEGELPKPKEAVRLAFEALCQDRTPNARKQGFSRAIKELRLEGFIDNGTHMLRWPSTPF